jgi:ribonuclease HI
VSREKRKEEAARLLRRLTDDSILAVVSERIPELDRHEIRDLLNLAADAVAPPPARGVDEATIQVDGAAIGNPGPAGAGVVILDAHNRKVAELSEPLGRTTNNVAEYRALILGLSKARQLGVRHVHVRADSELMVRQITGEYRIKDEKLQALSREALDIIDSFDSFDIRHVDRSENKAADRLSKRAAEANSER